MADFSDLATATKAVVDPSTSAADLAQIAQLQPGLRSQVAAHPNVYPGLLQWLDANGDAVTKQAVAVRQAAQQAVPYYAAVQPGHGSFAYQGAYGGPMAGAPVVRRSKRPLVIGIVAVVVVAAIAVTLLVWKPWQKSGSGPTLTVGQFVTMVNGDQDTFGTFDSPVTVQDVQQGVTELSQGSDFSHCDACAQSMSKMTGAIFGGESPATMLFGSAADATAFVSAVADYLNGGAAEPGVEWKVTTTSGGVWLATPYSTDSRVVTTGGAIMTQYGNVFREGALTCSSDSDCSSQAQTIAAAFKQDIDQAAKG